MHAAAAILRASGLGKRYADTVAVDDVSFAVGRNEIVGLLGPNGAGKTTTINMTLGLLAPDAGSIHIDGVDLARERERALARTNFAAVYAPLPGWSRTCAASACSTRCRSSLPASRRCWSSSTCAISGMFAAACCRPASRLALAWPRRC